MKRYKLNSPLLMGYFVIFLHCRVSALHCHRKHDHSSDILLQGDTSNDERYVQGAAAVSSSNIFYSERLVQQQQEELKAGNKRHLLEKSPNEQSSHHLFCPDLSGCTCNFTSTNRLQVMPLCAKCTRD